MKITKEHLTQLAEIITPFDTPELRAKYKEHDLTDKRYRWNLVFMAGLVRDPKSCTRFICDVLYEYLTDDHIDTALRSIVKPL